MSRRLEQLWYPAEPESPGRRLALAPLRLASAAFGAGARLRGVLYDRGWLQTHRVEGAKVVSVGNVNVGGAGKTPAVIALAERLHARGERVAVLSRGYGRTRHQPLTFGAGTPEPSVAEAGDEPILVSRRCPWAKVYVGADRVARAAQAVSEGATALVLDDGFQHRRLHRDLDIVVVDADAGFGNGQLLPRGPLREPPEALRRADLIWLRLSPGAAAPAAAWSQPTVEAFYETTTVVRGGRATDAAAVLAGAPVVALTAIARPGSFVRSLEALGAQVKAVHAFPDHHLFAAAELAGVEAAARRLGALVVTTEKDAVRLPPAFEVAVLRLSVRLGAGAATLDALLGRART